MNTFPVVVQIGYATDLSVDILEGLYWLRGWHRPLLLSVLANSGAGTGLVGKLTGERGTLQGALTDHVRNSAGTVALGHQMDVIHHPTWPSVFFCVVTVVVRCVNTPNWD